MSLSASMRNDCIRKLQMLLEYLKSVWGENHEFTYYLTEWSASDKSNPEWCGSDKTIITDWIEDLKDWDDDPDWNPGSPGDLMDRQWINNVMKSANYLYQRIKEDDQ